MSLLHGKGMSLVYCTGMSLVYCTGISLVYCTGMSLVYCAGISLLYCAGMSLVYPGSLSLMGMLLETPLLEGRSKLVLEFQGSRNKIRTRDNNHIDTMYINQSTK